MTIPATLTGAAAAGRCWDVLVVGAGPAGSLAARELARRRLAVLLVDRNSFPRGKVCGCCLNGAAQATLTRAGLAHLLGGCGARPLREIRLASGRWSARVPLERALVLSREALDAALVVEALRAGSSFLPRTRAELAEAEELHRWVILHEADHFPVRVQARLVLSADGLGGYLLARAGLASSRVATHAHIGAGITLPEAPAFYHPGTVFMAVGAGGYVGLVGLEDGRLDVAAALDTAQVRAAGGPGPAVRRLLDEVRWPFPDAGETPAWRGTPALTRHAERRATHRVLAIGDAAGYVEPFTGEGIAWALASGWAVVPVAERATANWQPSLAREWEALYRLVITRRQIFCRTTALVLRSPPLTRALIAILARAPLLARPFVASLNASPSRKVARP